MKLRTLLGAAVVLTALLFQEAYAVPNAAIAALRANACCAGKCRRALDANKAAQCCRVNRSDQDPATLSRLKPVAFPTFAVVPGWRLNVARETAKVRSFALPARDVFARPAPIFLVDESLRL
jgi:hypothetical protein